MKIGKRIEDLLLTQQKSRAALARYVEVSVQAVGHWIADGSMPLPSKLRKIADFFNITEEELLFGPAADRPSPKRVSILQWDEARYPQRVVDNDHPVFSGPTFQVSIPMQRHTFALTVRGDSMLNPTGAPSFPPGCIIVVEPSARPESGDYVIAERAGAHEATFAQYVEEAGRYLKPLNPRYPILPLSEADRIVGVVMEYWMRLK